MSSDRHLGAARAIGRVLKASGEDLHRFAAELLSKAPAEVVPAHQERRPRRERTPRTAPLDAEVLRLLRAGLALDCFSAWETGFAETILNAADRRTWRPTTKQHDIIDRLASKAQEAEAHP